MYPEPDLAAVAALIGDSTRATILSALLSGEALPASELAYRAHVTPQTASAHLAKLLEGNLIKVTQAGRHRYYALKNHEVAQLLEALAQIAPLSQPLPPRAARISPELCNSRTCYDHLAGKLGVALTTVLVEQNYLVEAEQNYQLTTTGAAWLQEWQVDVTALQQKRRKFAYACLDWSERRFHLAGALGAAVADWLFDRRWIQRLPHTRAITVTPVGTTGFKENFGIDWHIFDIQ